MVGGFFQHENETIDVFLPIVGVYAGAVLSALTRLSYGRSEVEYSTQELKEMTGICRATAARSIQILSEFGLIQQLPTSGNQKSRCILVDLKALATSYGATVERGKISLPPTVVEMHKNEVKALRQRQQGKGKHSPGMQTEALREVAAKSGFSSISSVSQRDASVSQLIRQRSTRETQLGTHLLQKEERTEEYPSQTPSHDWEMQTPKNLSNENERHISLKWECDRFNGAMDEMRAHILDTNRMPNPHLANGYVDWEQFGFNRLAVEAATWHGKVLALVLSATDPAAARCGLEKYHRKWEKALSKWYRCEVHVELQKAREKW